MPNTTQFLITFAVKPDRIPDFAAMLATVKTDLPNVDGCQSVRIFQHDTDAQDCFTLLETWDDKSLHQAHVARLQESGDWDTIEAMLATPPNGHYMQAF